MKEESAKSCAEPCQKNKGAIRREKLEKNETLGGKTEKCARKLSFRTGITKNLDSLKETKRKKETKTSRKKRGAEICVTEEKQGPTGQRRWTKKNEGAKPVIVSNRVQVTSQKRLGHKGKFDSG